jgi:outer membrane lipoprotein-sorting protein
MRTVARTLMRLGLAALLLAAPGLVAAATEQAALSPDDAAAVNRAVRYLNEISTLKARFIQVSSNGAYAEGEVLIARPGKLRFDYDPPHPALMIANGLTLLFYDRELKQASFLPLWETPLWFLIREEVRLADDVAVTLVEHDRGSLRVTLQDTDTPDAGAVTLVFSDNPLALKKWELVDPQGIATQVSLVNPRFGVEIDPDLFEYDDLEIQMAPTRPEAQ